LRGQQHELEQVFHVRQAVFNGDSGHRSIFNGGASRWTREVDQCTR
jgi:hypothetical protein